MGDQEQVYPRPCLLRDHPEEPLAAASSEMGSGLPWNRQGWSLPEETKLLVGESSMEMGHLLSHQGETTPPLYHYSPHCCC